MITSGSNEDGTPFSKEYADYLKNATWKHLPLPFGDGYQDDITLIHDIDLIVLLELGFSIKPFWLFEFNPDFMGRYGKGVCAAYYTSKELKEARKQSIYYEVDSKLKLVDFIKSKEMLIAETYSSL